MRQLIKWLNYPIISGWLLFAVGTAIADQVNITYLDDDGNAQTLMIDVNASDADNTLAAELILEGSKILVILDEKEDLEVIAEAVSAKAPDNATKTAVSNTILGVGTSLGGRSIQRTPLAPEAIPRQVDTPPLPPPLPPPSSSSLPPPSSSIPPAPGPSSPVSPN